MTISDERFELNMQGLEADGLPGTAAELRARDTAQREALARVEAERDAVLAKAPTQWAYDQACTALHKQRELANTAQALLREVDTYLSGYGDNAICNGSRLHRDIKDLLAGQLAVAGTTSDQYRAELYDEVWQKARDMGYGNVTEALVALDRMKAALPEPVAIANRGKGAFWVRWTDAAEGLYGPEIKLYTAPPAAAHGDEAMDELRRSVAEILGQDPDSWPSHGNAPLAICSALALATMRAQRPGHADA